MQSPTTVSGPTSEGGGGPLGYVAETPGTITYGALPEAQQSAPKQIIDVHNGVKFAGPENGEGGAACGADELVRLTGLDAAALSIALSELELAGLVSLDEGVYRAAG